MVVVMKGMIEIVVETRRRTVHVGGGLDVPGGCLAENAGVTVLALRAGGGAGTLMVWQEGLSPLDLDFPHRPRCGWLFLVDQSTSKQRQGRQKNTYAFIATPLTLGLQQMSFLDA